MTFITRVIIVPLELQFSIISSYSSFQFDWLTASLLFVPRERNLARGTSCRHLYCSNHSDQTWDKYDVFFIYFLLFFFLIWGKFILSETPSFHDLPPFLQSAPQRKCILWQPFHLNSWSVSLLRSFDVFGVFWFQCIAQRWLRAIPAC